MPNDDFYDLTEYRTIDRYAKDLRFEKLDENR